LILRAEQITCQRSLEGIKEELGERKTTDQLRQELQELFLDLPCSHCGKNLPISFGGSPRHTEKANNGAFIPSWSIMFQRKGGSDKRFLNEVFPFQSKLLLLDSSDMKKVVFCTSCAKKAENALKKALPEETEENNKRMHSVVSAAGFWIQKQLEKHMEEMSELENQLSRTQEKLSNVMRIKAEVEEKIKKEKEEEDRRTAQEALEEREILSILGLP